MRNVTVNHEEQKNKRIVKPVLVGTGFAMILLLILLVLFSIIFANADIPTYVLTPTSIFILTLCALFDGFFAARLTKVKGMTVGLAAGGALFIMLFILNLICLHNGIGLFMFAKLLLLLISAAIGGVFGVNFSIKRK